MRDRFFANMDNKKKNEFKAKLLGGFAGVSWFLTPVFFPTQPQKDASAVLLLMTIAGLAAIGGFKYFLESLNNREDPLQLDQTLSAAPRLR